MWDLCWEKYSAGFLRELRVPLPIFISPAAPNSLITPSSKLYSLDTVSLNKQFLKIILMLHIFGRYRRYDMYLTHLVMTEWKSKHSSIRLDLYNGCVLLG
jgi:hypothetical protein